MSRLLLTCYHFECRLFQKVNQHFDKKMLNIFFRTITHLGGAVLTIAAAILLMLFSPDEAKMVSFASALSLAVSHLPVQITKKLFPRKRPYLTLDQTRYPVNPLKDHSFPSGHTTASLFTYYSNYALYSCTYFSFTPFRTMCWVIENLFRTSLPIRCCCGRNYRNTFRYPLFLFTSIKRHDKKPSEQSSCQMVFFVQFPLLFGFHPITGMK